MFSTCTAGHHHRNRAVSCKPPVMVGNTLQLLRCLQTTAGCCPAAAPFCLWVVRGLWRLFAAARPANSAQ